MKTFIQKLKHGHTYIRWTSFSINEGGFWFTFHISINKWIHYFRLRIFFFGKSWQILWKKPSHKAEIARLKYKVEHTWNDAMRNGVIVEIREPKDESTK